MKKQTSKKVASLAAIWMDCTGEDLRGYFEDNDLDSLANILRTLSASVLSQREEPST